MVTQIEVLDNEHVVIFPYFLFLLALENILKRLHKREWVTQSVFLPSVLRSVQVVARFFLVMEIIEAFFMFNVLPSTFIAPVYKAQFIADKGWEPIAFKSAGEKHVLLSGALYKVKPKSTKWLLFLNPNRAAFEQLMEYIQRYATRMEVNAMAFNFRGVGRSGETHPFHSFIRLTRIERSADLIDDGKGAVKYLMENLGVHPSNIIVHGWSLGGVVAPFLQLEWSQIGVILDRSWCSTQAVGEEVLSADPFLGFLCGTFLALAFVKIILGLDRRSIQVAIVLGGGLGALGFASPLAPLLLSFFQYDIDPVSAALATPLESRMLILYHHNDGVIPFNSSFMGCLPTSALDNRSKTWKTMELTIEHRSNVRNHIYQLSSSPDEWQAFHALANQLFLQSELDPDGS